MFRSCPEVSIWVALFGSIIGNCRFVLIIRIRQRCSNSPQAINNNRFKQIESLFPKGNNDNRLNSPEGINDNR